MAVPTATNRVTPTGRKLGIGGPTYLTFESDSDLDFWEQSVKPPSFQMDDRKDNTTSYNNRIRSFSPGRLMTGQDVTSQGGYDPDEEQDIIDLMGVRDTLTVTLPSGTQIAFYGWLDSIDFNDHNEDDDPMVTLGIAQGNQDWATCVEQAPVIYPGSGTTPTC